MGQESPLKRWAMLVEYSGERFCGWQRQKGLRTVQQTVEEALSAVADRQISVVGAGRTDTGVHASGQVIHFETDAERSSRAWVYGSNSHLPSDVSIGWAKEVDTSFHARYSALERRYQYFICNRPIRPSLCPQHITWQYRPLNVELMHTAAQAWVGEHDFSSFRGVDCQSRSPYRRVHAISVSRQEDLICVDLKANAFLHHMVRNFVGVLIGIGTGQQEPSWAEYVLKQRDRRAGGQTAPPYGLYLVQVRYPDVFELPESPSSLLLPTQAWMLQTEYQPPREDGGSS